VWNWNTVSGDVVVNKAYDYIVQSIFSKEQDWWFSSIWKVKDPLKTITFCWLCLTNKFLTGENYMKQGGYGPIVCMFCLKDYENVQHLFVDYLITRRIWSKVLSTLKIKGRWGMPYFDENLKSWFSIEYSHKVVPLIGN